MTKKGFDYDEVKSQLENVWDKTLDALNKGKQEVVRYSKMGKIKLDTQMMERDKNYLFQKLGEETYKGLKKDKLDTSTLKKYVEKIEKINARIKKQNATFTELNKNPAGKSKKSTKKK